MKSYLITWAQNATPVHKGFFEAMQVWSKHTHGEVVVIPGRYKNATSQWTAKQQESEWWADEVVPFLAGRFRQEQMAPKRIKLCRSLTVFGDVSIQPTAARPLSGFAAFTKDTSAVFGHPRRALQTVPTNTRIPRIMFTTGACTVANYTDSKAGKKAEAHHVIGGVVVEVDRDGIFFCRHVSADTRTGAFYDLDLQFSVGGVATGQKAVSLTLGDWHDHKKDHVVAEATKALCDLVRPKHLVLHDFLDFGVRNHHIKTTADRHGLARCLVEHEVIEAAQSLRHIAKAWRVELVHVVRSNHDEAFERWVEEFKPKEDLINVPYWHRVCAAHYAEPEKYSGLFEQECRRLGVTSKVHFLRRNEHLMIGGSEHGLHGDKGPGGSRGSTNSYTNLGCKVTKAHDHMAAIVDSVYSVGTTALLDQGYNLLPSGWTQSHVLGYPDGKRACVFILKGRHRGGMV